MARRNTATGNEWRGGVRGGKQKRARRVPEGGEAHPNDEVARQHGGGAPCEERWRAVELHREGPAGGRSGR